MFRVIRDPRVCHSMDSKHFMHEKSLDSNQWCKPNITKSVCIKDLNLIQILSRYLDVLLIRISPCSIINQIE